MKIFHPRNLCSLFLLFALVILLQLTNLYVEVTPKTYVKITKPSRKYKAKPAKKTNTHNATSATRNNLFSKWPCTAPVEHATFLKTHKTASTVVFNLMTKWRKRHKFPLEDGVARSHPAPWLGGYPGHVNFSFIKLLAGDKASFLNGHFRFDALALRENLPEDTRYFTILRNPWHQFQSSFHYFRQRKSKNLTSRCVKKSMPRVFLERVAGGQISGANRYLDVCARFLNKSIPFYFRAKNLQAFDLGLDPFLVDDALIAKKVAELDANFDLVMITEYFEESLILLKELLCLNFGNLLYYKKNIGSYQFEELENPTLFAQHQRLDLLLYEHFNRSLWTKVDKFGRDRMHREVKTLRSLLASRNIEEEGALELNNHFLNYERAQNIKSSGKVAEVSSGVSKLVAKEIANKKANGMIQVVSDDLLRYMDDNGANCHM